MAGSYFWTAQNGVLLRYFMLGVESLINVAFEVADGVMNTCERLGN